MTVENIKNECIKLIEKGKTEQDNKREIGCIDYYEKNNEGEIILFRFKDNNEGYYIRTFIDLKKNHIICRFEPWEQVREHIYFKYNNDKLRNSFTSHIYFGLL